MVCRCRSFLKGNLFVSSASCFEERSKATKPQVELVRSGQLLSTGGVSLEH